MEDSLAAVNAFNKYPTSRRHFFQIEGNNDSAALKESLHGIFTTIHSDS
jgi:hypothetical protein